MAPPGDGEFARTPAPADLAFARSALSPSAVALLPRVAPPAAAVYADAERVLAGTFLIIGEQYELGAAFSWAHNPSHDKEWLIAHHKHYTLVSLLHLEHRDGDGRGLARFVELLTSWLDEMGTGFIAQSDAQVEAKRLESWLAARALLAGLPWEHHVPDALVRRWCDRAWQEAGYVIEHLKATRNHRTFELWSSFAVAVAQPWEPGAAELRDRAAALLTENLLHDIHPDGVHIEGSTHYHQLVTETALGFLEVSAAAGLDLDPRLRERVRRAAHVALWVQWPGGGIPLVNDADDGDQRDLLDRAATYFGDEELRFGATLGAAGTAPTATTLDLPDGGMVMMSDTWGDDEGFAQRIHVVVDAGVLGEGSHSHYDQMSLVLWAAGGPVVVDPGRYTYNDAVGPDGVNWRHHFKSTAAHNTVQIDGLDQTRYTSRTKHGPDSVVRDRSVGEGPGGVTITGTVHSQEYAPRHTRTVLFAAREYLVVIDRVDPIDGDDHTATLRWHLPTESVPAARPGRSPDAVTWDVARAAIRVHVASAGASPAHSLDVEDGWVSVEYGVKHRAAVLRATAAASSGSGAPASFVSVIVPSLVRTRPLALVRSELSIGDGVLRVETVLDGAERSDEVRWSDGARRTGTDEWITLDRDGVRLPLR